ncbi:MAG: hypothetical protein ACR2PI_17425 [Hyphomicrobiaceae bacterium]
MQTFAPLFAAALLLTPTYGNAQERQVKGSEFVTIMNGNTLSATNKAGVKFKAYFVGGGIATYEDEKGTRDHGRWRVKNGEEVCVIWKMVNNGQEHCARVYVSGNEILWKGEHISGEGKLLGTVQ